MDLAAETQADSDRTIPQGHVLGTYYPRSFARPGVAVEVVVCSGPYDWATNPGDGSLGNPYQIQTASQLDSLGDRWQLWRSDFVLTADIDMTGRTYSKALIGQDLDDGEDGFQGQAFTGTFDGGGFKILNLSIASATSDYLGLFGYISQGGLVTQVNLVRARVRGDLLQSSYVGSLAGCNAGTITHCSSQDESVRGHMPNVGALVGLNAGKVEDCHTSGSVEMGG